MFAKNHVKISNTDNLAPLETEEGGSGPQKRKSGISIRRVLVSTAHTDWA